MSIRRKFPLALAIVVVAAFASTSSATAADGVLRDVSNTQPIAANTELHGTGWVRFQAAGSGMTCHTTGTVKANAGGSTGTVTNFSIVTSTCHGFGVAYANCTITADTVENLPYEATVTPTDIEVTDPVGIDISMFIGHTPNTTCNFTFTNMHFEEMTLKLLKTGTNVVTDTENHLGGTATAGTVTKHEAGFGDPIAGIEISGEGEFENDFAAFGMVTEGELELTSPNRCTFYLSSN